MDSTQSKRKIPRNMTEKQRAARLANLAAGRKKRMELLQMKKDGKQEYDLSSESDNVSSGDSGSESDAFIISKKKPKKTVKHQKLTTKDKHKTPPNRENEDKFLNNKVDRLEYIIEKMVTMQEKQNKVARKQAKKPSGGGTKIVVLPNSTGNTQAKVNDTMMEALRKSLM
jgi:hypothetical protein